MLKPVQRQPKPVDRYVGSRIRMRRNLLGMTQQTLGSRIGLTFQQVQKYEKGTNRVGSSRLQQIADVLETTPAWFFEGARGSQKGGAFADVASVELAVFMADHHAVRLVRGFVRLKPALKKGFVELIELVGA
jgi:transcriptional regulator with XRE-family HTH domain